MITKEEFRCLFVNKMLELSKIRYEIAALDIANHLTDEDLEEITEEYIDTMVKELTKASIGLAYSIVEESEQIDSEDKEVIKKYANESIGMIDDITLKN